MAICHSQSPHMHASMAGPKARTRSWATRRYRGGLGLAVNRSRQHPPASDALRRIPFATTFGGPKPRLSPTLCDVPPPRPGHTRMRRVCQGALPSRPRAFGSSPVAHGAAGALHFARPTARRAGLSVSFTTALQWRAIDLGLLLTLRVLFDRVHDGAAVANEVEVGQRLRQATHFC